MFAVVVTFHIKPDSMRDFLPLMKENAAMSLKQEPGCQRFDVWTDTAKPEIVYLYEIYEDPHAFELHKKSPHFLTFDSATAQMIEAKDVMTLDQLISG